MILRYRIPDETFADLTLGPSGPPTIALLRSSQLTKHKLLLVHLAEAAREWEECRVALHVLTEAERRAPRPTADLIVSPFIGAWAAWCVRRLQGSVGSTSSIRTDLSGLTGLAAVAALRAGLDVELPVRACDGLLSLPTLGALRLNRRSDPFVPAVVRDGAIVLYPHGEAVTMHGGEAVTVRHNGEAVTVHEDGGPAGSSWRPVRQLRADVEGMALSVTLDDLDPYRGCHGRPIADRLTAAEFASWAGMFRDAWALLVAHAPGRAQELMGGMRSLVPLSTAHTGPGLSATSRTAFGALGLTLPAQPEHLAVTLVHEFQHSKLSALLDMIPLYDLDARDRYFAPWRPDPRPIGGLLQGAYAFLAVSELWHRLRGQLTVTVDATRHFAELREQVRHALETLNRSPHLNADGRKFVQGLTTAHGSLMAETLPSAAVESALIALDATFAAWPDRLKAQAFGSN